MRSVKIIVVFVFLILFANSGYTQNASDYLILQSIGDYHSSGKGKCGKGSGIIATTGHFKEDHNDLNCRTGYYNMQQDLAVSIQVTQHTNSDSDKWLLHEVDAEFRNYYGIPGLSYTVKNIDGNIVFVFSSGGRDYRWLSGNKVVIVEYTDLMMEKPEPLEIVRAYLAKHPSTLQPMTLVQLRSTDNKTKWIKDEMERRLWLCDKWFMALQLGKAEQKAVLQNTVDSMQVFLDYREKYYGIKAADEKNLLANYLLQNNGTGIKNKLTEYKNWWVENKGNPINL
jgi:hypothetical protein